MNKAFTLCKDLSLLKFCIPVVLAASLSVPAQAQNKEENSDKKVSVKKAVVTDDNNSKTVEYIVKNGKKKLIVETLSNGETKKEVYTGEEAEAYWEKNKIVQADELKVHKENSFSFDDNEIIIKTIDGEDLEERIEIKMEEIDGNLEELLENLKIDIDITEENGTERIKIVKIGDDGSKNKHNVVMIRSNDRVRSKEEADELLEDLGVDVEIDENAEGTVKTIIYKKIIRIENVTNKDAVSSNERLKVSEMNLYPNPSSGMFKIEFEPEKKGETNIVVSDINGKELFRDRYNGEGQYQKELDLSSEKNGIYFVQISQGKKQHTKKIVIQ